MRVKMLTLMANADGVFDKDKEFDMDDKVGKNLVSNGFAVCVDKPVAKAEEAEEKPAPKKKGKKVE